MVELKGSLGGIGLPAIVQFISQLQRSGTLELVAGARRGLLAFEKGRLVASDFAQEHGVEALATLYREFADGEFSFHEGVPTSRRTLDIATKDFESYFGAMMTADKPPRSAVAPDVPGVTPPPLGPCPLLGFADDRTCQYSRPTMLHRCFATEPPSVVDGREQRDLCLSGRYQTCPRYRPATPSGLQQTPSGGAEPAPAGGLSRPAAASQIAPVTSRPAGTAQPKIAPAAAAVASSRPRPQPDTRPPPPSGRRGLPGRTVWIGASIVVGLGLVLMVVLLLVLPNLGDGSAAPDQAVARVQARGPAPTATSVPALTVTPAPAPTNPSEASAVGITPAQAPALVALPLAPEAAPGPSPAGALPRPPTPSSAASGLGIAPIGQPLLDVRFGSKPVAGWLENPPFVSWADGAYRLQARQATHFVAVGAPIDKPLSDVVLSATFRKTGGPPGGGYGLVVRDQGPSPRDGANQMMNTYVFEAGDLGQFGVWRRAGDRWVDLMSWTPSAVVRLGASANDLAVRAIGSRFTFTINGTEVASIEDGTLTAGGVGVFVGGDFNEVALDHFTVEVPD